ncbi:NACHT domain-containing protein [Almyronema epifaneia]|uniref:NACHT domain-containing protein n=1 Tax=Almyronema epifaneia S1 TaxID=2991925 RepID=A0ABW6IED3_9CYAN
MAARSLTATPESIEPIDRALTEKGWSREDLAQRCECSRQPAVKFCSGKSVSRKLFVSFCKALDLNWEEIAGLKPTAATLEPIKAKADIDALVQTIRQQVKADIHHRCGTMRVLDMTQPIGLGDIYTDVNILEKLSGRRRLGIADLLENCDLENFDRFSLGQIHHERVPGLEAVERHNKLLILGKPGAGKTTFMKRLATLCNQGKFQAQQVPIFVTLKEFAEAQEKPGLQAYIANQWQACEVEAVAALAVILQQGRALILLDGLDEVQAADHDRILQEIKGFTHQFRGCQFVMTCRIAAREYTFQQFTEVEVADFNPAQIEDFATKWFQAKQDAEKGKIFIQRLKDNKPIQELATNPLLLTLLCLVFGEAADFPANRSELYKEGLDVLLKKWDAKRNIERDQVYKKLSLKRKEDLLSQLALQTFARGDYFFKQKVVEQQIIDYIRNLPGANEDAEALQLDSEAVLKSIAAQHGLLVERASGIYSFSHLTFQEYFTAKQITSPTAQLQAALENLVTHITEKRYCEIFLLAVGMLPEADGLLLAMKSQADQLIGEDASLQAFLGWVEQKSHSVNATYKPAAIRAFYLGLDLYLTCTLDQSLYLAYALDRIFGHALEYTLEYTPELIPALDLDLDFDLYICLDFNLDFDLDFNLNLDLTLTHSIKQVSQSDPALKLKLEALKDQLPDKNGLEEDLQAWWQEHGDNWTDNLRSAMIEHRNIGHDWQFTEEQQASLQQYYNANRLLVACLNSDCYVTKATRQYIEDTLLLPMSEIEKYQPPSP